MDLDSPDLMCTLKPEWRFDCYPEPGATEDGCTARNCCWIPGDPDSGEPFCFYPKSFTYYKWGQPIQTDFGLEVKAFLVDQSPYPRDIKNLTIRVYYETEGSLRVKVSPFQQMA